MAQSSLDPTQALDSIPVTAREVHVLLVCMVSLAGGVVAVLFWGLGLSASSSIPFYVALFVAGVSLLYVVVWVLSRVGGERRVLFFQEGVWLPGTGPRLSGRYVTYSDIVSLDRYGKAGQSLIVRFKGSSRRFPYDLVDVGSLESQLTNRLSQGHAPSAPAPSCRTYALAPVSSIPPPGSIPPRRHQIDGEQKARRLARALLADVELYHGSLSDEEAIAEARGLFHTRVAPELHAAFDEELWGQIRTN